MIHYDNKNFKLHQIGFGLLCAITILACTTTKTNNSDPNELIRAVVKDYSALASCRKILLTDNGEKILPKNHQTLVPFSTNEIVYIAYNKIPDMVSLCMAEDFIAEIVEIKSDPNKTKRIPCKSVNSVNQLPWATPYIKNPKLDIVQQFKDNRHQWFYLFVYLDGHATLFNCQGDNIRNFNDLKDRQAIIELIPLKMISLIYKSNTKQR